MTKQNKKYKYITVSKPERLALRLALTVLADVRDGRDVSQFQHAEHNKALADIIVLLEILLNRSEIK